MKLTSHALYWDNGDASPHVSAVFTFDKGTSLDLVVKHLEACGQSTQTGASELQVKNLESEIKALLKDFNDKNAALQEIQGTYVRVHSELKQLRTDYEKAVTELDAVRLENVALKRAVDELKERPSVVDMRDSKFEITQRFAEGFNPDRVAKAFVEDLEAIADVKLNTPTITPEEYEKLVADEPEKTPKDLFREVFVKECADIKGTSTSEVLDRAYAVFTARRAEAASYGLQRELGSALTMAIADCLNKEPADASALFSVKLDSMSGKAAMAKEAEEKANEPELLTKFNEAMVSPQVKSKTSIRQKIVASLALICAKDGKVKLSDMVNAAESLRKVTLKEDEWRTVLDKGGNGKSQLDILHRIVASGLELTVV